MIEKVLASMFGLILVFLLLTRASEFNSIVSAVADFVTTQTAILQGRSVTGQPNTVVSATQRTSSAFGL
jgi:hypothetical protein